MFDKIKALLKLRAAFKQLKEICKMKFSINVIVQLLGVLLQLYNQLSGMIPSGYKEIIALVVGIIQGLVALLAHFTNPDGTPAAEPYTK
jgi:hypothetical protein